MSWIFDAIECANKLVFITHRLNIWWNIIWGYSGWKLTKKVSFLKFTCKANLSKFWIFALKIMITRHFMCLRQSLASLAKNCLKRHKNFTLKNSAGKKFFLKKKTIKRITKFFSISSFFLMKSFILRLTSVVNYDLNFWCNRISKQTHFGYSSTRLHIWWNIIWGYTVSDLK